MMVLMMNGNGGWVVGMNEEGGIDCRMRCDE